MKEAEFLLMVLNLAKLCGWLSMHQRPARTKRGWVTATQGDGKGWPDLILLRGTVLIFAELKASQGELTTEQKDWLTALHTVSAVNQGVQVHFWRPADWDEIEKVLTEDWK